MHSTLADVVRQTLALELSIVHCCLTLCCAVVNGLGMCNSLICLEERGYQELVSRKYVHERVVFH